MGKHNSQVADILRERTIGVHGIPNQQSKIIYDIIEKLRITPDPYDENFGDYEICNCGHPYYRHFDTYDNMYACGCKYCECKEFERDT